MKVGAPLRFPQPWDIEDNSAESGRRTSAGLLTRDKARRIAINVAKLAELVKGPQY
jgi:hypothetical protein